MIMHDLRILKTIWFQKHPFPPFYNTHVQRVLWRIMKPRQKVEVGYIQVFTHSSHRISMFHLSRQIWLIWSGVGFWSWGLLVADLPTFINILQIRLVASACANLGHAWLLSSVWPSSVLTLWCSALTRLISFFVVPAKEMQKNLLWR